MGLVQAPFLHYSALKLHSSINFTHNISFTRSGMCDFSVILVEVHDHHLLCSEKLNGQVIIDEKVLACVKIQCSVSWTLNLLNLILFGSVLKTFSPF